MPVTIVLGVLLLVSLIGNIALILSAFNDRSLNNGQVYVPPTGNGGQVLPPDQPVELEIGDSPAKGNEDADVIVVEFSDFQCPFCQRYYNDAYKQIQSEYVDTGKVYFVFKQFPLTSIHPQAQKAGEASLCANDQNKFWEYHDALFENQQALDVTSLKQYAADLGLNTATFNNCLDSGKYTARVNAEVAEGSAAGVSGTPTTFINGKKVVGAVPYSTIKAEIEAALAQ
jgi:protein-disulfide isomerase